ncbi:unnamed protein product [Ascophyllum nodosum]
MLADSVFTLSMWGDLFMAATYFKNRTPYKALKIETPLKTLHGGKIDLSHLAVIGSKTFLHIKNSRKLDAAA